VAPWKGHDQLLEAFSMVLKRCPQATLHIFGRAENAFALELRRRSEEMHISKSIIWHGFVSDKHKIFPLVEVVAVPSITPDPLPTVAIEAAFFGKPVVAYAVGGLPEIVANNGTGLLVPPGDSAQLAAALMDLLQDPNRMHVLASRARSHAQENFSARAFGQHFRRILSHDETGSNFVRLANDCQACPEEG
jgi:glycosyltransferase involved in cell wall biosynthesis